MNKIYEQSKDLHVKATYIYVSAAKAYADEDHKIQFKTSELKELFLKGAVIVDSGVSYAPVSFAIASEIGTISYVKPNATTSTSADIAKAVSVKDE